jgi:hypothetical protein
MAKLASTDFNGRDAIQDDRIPVKNGVVIKSGQFVKNTNNEIDLATDEPTGFALTGTTGNTAKKCSIVYLAIEDGSQFLIPPSTAGAVYQTGYYTLANADTINVGSFNIDPIQGKMNFLWDGRLFTAHSY